MESPPSRPRRHVIRISAMLLLVVATLEIGAYVASAVRTGSPRPFTAWKEQQAQLVRRAADRKDAETRTSRGERASQGTGEREEVIHPYLGFLSELSSGVAGPEDVALDSVEFYDSNSALYHPSDEQLVVGITGGSVAVQFATGPGAKLLRQLLGQSPAHRDERIIVVNLATNGFKQPQQLMAVTYALSLGVHFDLVLNIDGFNEVALHVAENGKKGVFPSFPRGWYFRAGRSPDPDILPVMGMLAVAQNQRTALARAAIESSWRWSPTYQLIWSSRDGNLSRRIAAHKKWLRDARPERRDPRRTGPATEFADEEALYHHLADRWADGSRQLERLCRVNGIRYYHFLQPNQYVEGSKTLSPEEIETAFDEDQPYRPGVLAGYPVLRQLGAQLRQEGIGFTDFVPLFEGIGETLYKDDCCHMNGRGNELMAEAIAEIVLE